MLEDDLIYDVDDNRIVIRYSADRGFYVDKGISKPPLTFHYDLAKTACKIIEDFKKKEHWKDFLETLKQETKGGTIMTAMYEKKNKLNVASTEDRERYPYSGSYGVRGEAAVFLDKAFTPVHVIFHPPATIVFWKDGSKTVVKCAPGEKFNKYHGFCAAVAKKIYANNTQLNKMIESIPVEGEKKSDVKQPASKDTKAQKKETKKK